MLSLRVAQPSDYLWNYHQQKNDYLYNKVILSPIIEYKGELADIYTTLYVEGKKIMNHPSYSSYLTAKFNEMHFGEEASVNPPDPEFQNKNLEISKQQNLVLQKTEEQLGIHSQTVGWKRLKNGQFDTSLPATLIIQPFEYNKVEFDKLKKMANNIIKSFQFKKDENEEDCYVFKIEYSL